MRSRPVTDRGIREIDPPRRQSKRKPRNRYCAVFACLFQAVKIRSPPFSKPNVLVQRPTTIEIEVDRLLVAFQPLLCHSNQGEKSGGAATRLRPVRRDTLRRLRYVHDSDCIAWPFPFVGYKKNLSTTIIVDKFFYLFSYEPSLRTKRISNRRGLGEFLALLLVYLSVLQANQNQFRFLFHTNLIVA